MTAKTVEAKVWAEACSLLCWVPNPALGAPQGDAAYRWQDLFRCTYLGMQAPGKAIEPLGCFTARQALPICYSHRHRARFQCHYYIVWR